MEIRVSNETTFSRVTLDPVLRPQLVRVSWDGRGRRYSIPILKRWQRWRERRGVGFSKWRQG